VLGERVALIGGLLAAAAVLAWGICQTSATGDPHWINRAGAGIVALQAVAAFGEFVRRSRLRRIERALTEAREKPRSILRRESRVADDAAMRTFVREEIEQSELQALLIVLSLAAFGEGLHGFGDLLWEWLVNG
jgi:hypothetical protein